MKTICAALFGLVAVLQCTSVIGESQLRKPRLVRRQPVGGDAVAPYHDFNRPRGDPYHLPDWEPESPASQPGYDHVEPKSLQKQLYLAESRSGNLEHGKHRVKHGTAGVASHHAIQELWEINRDNYADLGQDDNVNLHRPECTLCRKRLPDGPGSPRSKGVSELGCGHSFHTACLEKWNHKAIFGMGSNCPRCHAPYDERNPSRKLSPQEQTAAKEFEQEMAKRAMMRSHSGKELGEADVGTHFPQWLYHKEIWDHFHHGPSTSDSTIASPARQHSSVKLADFADFSKMPKSEERATPQAQPQNFADFSKMHKLEEHAARQFEPPNAPHPSRLPKWEERALPANSPPSYAGPPSYDLPTFGLKGEPDQGYSLLSRLAQRRQRGSASSHQPPYYSQDQNGQQQSHPRNGHQQLFGQNEQQPQALMTQPENGWAGKMGQGSSTLQNGHTNGPEKAEDGRNPFTGNAFQEQVYRPGINPFTLERAKSIGKGDPTQEAGVNPFTLERAKSIGKGDPTQEAGVNPFTLERVKSIGQGDPMQEAGLNGQSSPKQSA